FARRAFALVSVATLAMTGFCAWLAFRRPISILLAPLLVLATPLFFYDSWAYLNVDIVGTFFVTMTLAACLKGTRQCSIFDTALLPGVFAGMALDCKYTLLSVILPVLLAIWLYTRPEHRLRWSLAAVCAMLVAFLIVAPYTVLDLPHFLDAVAFEGRH